MNLPRERYRLIFISAPISLFWLVVFRERPIKKLRELYIVTWINPLGGTTGMDNSAVKRFFPDLSKDSDSAKDEWKEINDNSLSDLVNLTEKWTGHQPHVLWEPGYEALQTFSVFNFSDILRERARKKEVFSVLTRFLSDRGICPKDVEEVWYSQSSFPVYLKHYYPEIRSIQFEHGMGDLVNIEKFLGPKTTVREWRVEFKRRIRAWIGSFDSLWSNADQFVTVFSAALARIVPPKNRKYLETLPTGDILRVTSRLVAESVRNPQSVFRVLVLVPNVSRLGLSPDKEAALLTRVIPRIYEHFQAKFPGETEIYLKARADFFVKFDRAIAQLSNTDSRYKVLRFEDQYGEVPVLEAFMYREKFDAIYASFSAALFISKIWCPEILRVTYHRMVTEILNEMGESSVPDFEVLDHFFYEKYPQEFLNWIPERI